MDTEATRTFASTTVPEGMSADAGAEPVILARNQLGSRVCRDVLTQLRLAPLGTDVCGQARKVQSQTFSSSLGLCTAANPTWVGLSLTSNDVYPTLPRHAEEYQTLNNLDCF